MSISEFILWLGKFTCTCYFKEAPSTNSIRAQEVLPQSHSFIKGVSEREQQHRGW
jgi:hypothetical protein